jgi:hypothetical protein
MVAFCCACQLCPSCPPCDKCLAMVEGVKSMLKVMVQLLGVGGLATAALATKATHHKKHINNHNRRQYTVNVPLWLYRPYCLVENGDSDLPILLAVAQLTTQEWVAEKEQTNERQWPTHPVYFPTLQVYLSHIAAMELLLLHVSGGDEAASQADNLPYVNDFIMRYNKTASRFFLPLEALERCCCHDCIEVRPLSRYACTQIFAQKMKCCDSASCLQRNQRSHNNPIIPRSACWLPRCQHGSL